MKKYLIILKGKGDCGGIGNNEAVELINGDDAKEQIIEKVDDYGGWSTIEYVDVYEINKEPKRISFNFDI